MLTIYPFRTLLNQLTSSIFWCLLFYDVLAIPLTLMYYVLPPLDSILLCRIPQALVTFIAQQGIMLADAVVIVRYFFIFHLKNPTAIQDDFWKVNELLFKNYLSKYFPRQCLIESPEHCQR